MKRKIPRDKQLMKVSMGRHAVVFKPKKGKGSYSRRKFKTNELSSFNFV